MQPVECEQSTLSKEVAMRSRPLREIREKVLQGMNIEELQQLEKSLEGGLSRLIKKKGEKIKTEIESLQQKGMELMEENNRLRHQVMEISRGGKLIRADSETIISESGPSSSESTTNSTRPPQDYESPNTSLKLGLNYG